MARRRVGPVGRHPRARGRRFGRGRSALSNPLRAAGQGARSSRPPPSRPWPSACWTAGAVRAARAWLEENLAGGAALARACAPGVCSVGAACWRPEPVRRKTTHPSRRPARPSAFRCNWWSCASAVPSGCRGSPAAPTIVPPWEPNGSRPAADVDRASLGGRLRRSLRAARRSGPRRSVSTPRRDCVRAWAPGCASGAGSPRRRGELEHLALLGGELQIAHGPFPVSSKVAWTPTRAPSSCCRSSRPTAACWFGRESSSNTICCPRARPSRPSARRWSRRLAPATGPLPAQPGAREHVRRSARGRFRGPGRRVGHEDARAPLVGGFASRARLRVWWPAAARASHPSSGRPRRAPSTGARVAPRAPPARRGAPPATPLHPRSEERPWSCRSWRADARWACSRWSRGRRRDFRVADAERLHATAQRHALALSAAPLRALAWRSLRFRALLRGSSRAAPGGPRCSRSPVRAERCSSAARRGRASACWRAGCTSPAGAARGPGCPGGCVPGRRDHDRLIGTAASPRRPVAARGRRDAALAARRAPRRGRSARPRRALGRRNPPTCAWWRRRCPNRRGRRCARSCAAGSSVSVCASRPWPSGARRSPSWLRASRAPPATRSRSRDRGSAPPAVAALWRQPWPDKPARARSTRAPRSPVGGRARDRPGRPRPSGRELRAARAQAVVAQPERRRCRSRAGEHAHARRSLEQDAGGGALGVGTRTRLAARPARLGPLAPESNRRGVASGLPVDARVEGRGTPGPAARVPSP